MSFVKETIHMGVSGVSGCWSLEDYARRRSLIIGSCLHCIDELLKLKNLVGRM